ncbi:NAD(P)-binding protein [Penicillium atrosanguineum]|uniref:NAD(P)-binding protein n=1 Tax=Penicillium atrosanguineum TaxID=1132637 RepID=A0A9W9GFY4_9EURO|nr:uncharacterized protein N7443_007641 [Penicillium atrosanguineum]KAJ5118709.1 NAD(P)-binding protein [Penicillium atrosanguineum]KAJ5119748.1 NAD(P)-binding protein [Penicillium atrosanguineum]KAJ5296748.1 hypothetical protein N7443_007641 [Penicillium atrosanguineum]KAJ5299508.1 NAD(P)-binding protein [Penicillium atrosanguineum]
MEQQVKFQDIIGPNPTFVGQSGTFPKESGVASICSGVMISPPCVRYLACLKQSWARISVSRFGMLKAVERNSALFLYLSFPVSYESGLDQILRFVAHIEIYSPTKTIRVHYDSADIKGPPVTLHIAETIDGTYKETTLRKTYEDPYTSVLKEIYAAVVEGKNIKTTAKDARKDLEIFGMIMRSELPTIDDNVSET